MKNILKKTHYISVRAIGSNINRLIMRLNTMGINIHNITYLNNKEIMIEMQMSDLKKVRRQNVSYKFKHIKNLGVYKYRDVFKKHHMILIAIIFGLFLLWFLSNIIVSVNVIHSNKEIRELVASELSDLGIKSLTYKKSYEDLQEIKNKILEKYPDKIEWLEINTTGMGYKVSIEERIITQIEEEKASCHIVATKDAIVTKVISHKGLNMVAIDKYVKSGDILISGNILVEENIKGTVCAVGEVYGEVWYEVSVSVPLVYNEEILTGKSRYNVLYETNSSKDKIFRSRLSNFKDRNKKMFNIFGLTLYWQKEVEVELIPKTYSEEEALEHALELSKEKINVKLNENEKIISQKVLKKTVNDSKMIVEVFVSVEEKISDSLEFTNLGDGSNDSGHNGESSQ